MHMPQARTPALTQILVPVMWEIYWISCCSSSASCPVP